MSGLVIHTGKVWAFVKVAVMAGEREIGFNRTPTVLLGNDVLNMQPEDRVALLGDVAVFASVLRSFNHQALEGDGHPHGVPRA